MKKIGVTLVILLFPLLCPLALSAYTSPGNPTGYVNDFVHILKPETVTSLNAELTDFTNKTTAEISVVTIPTFGTDETIETYATKLFEEWKIGKAKEDNGVLLLVAVNDKKVRIEVGYGLEPVITDIESAHIISDVITPAFQAGDYDGGITAATKRLELDAENGYPVSDTASDSSSSNSFGGFSQFIYPIIFGFVFLGSILGRSKSWWAGGVIGGVVGIGVGIFLGLVTGVIAFVILVPLGLLFDYLVSKNGGKNGRGPFPPFFLGGGGFGGGRGSGGGFGGFGGGSSGGGGASGGW